MPKHFHVIGCRAEAFIAVAFLSATGLSAATLVVDKLSGPYATIQAAVDAASVGDTIYIKNGIYDFGSKSDGFGTSMQNRVVIDKSLTLVGESKENTIIKGRHATSPTDGQGLGLGADAVRCVAIKADNVVISNLTITGGATHNTDAGSDKEENNGGGVYVPNGRAGIVIVDCIVSNNAALRAAQIRHGNDGAGSHYKCLLARTWLDGGRALNRDSSIRGCLAVHCLFTRHFSTGSIEYSATYVNCTFADGNCRNHGDSLADGRVFGYNCIFADTWYKDDGKGRWFNCSFNKDQSDTTSTTNDACVFNPGYDLFIAPPLNDYRIHNGATTVIGKGDSSYLALESIPAAYRYVDFYGHAFNPSSVNLGCSQEVITPTGGKVAIDHRTGASKIGSVGNYGAALDCGLYSFNGRPIYASYYLGYVRAALGLSRIVISHDASIATEPSRQKGLHSFDASGVDVMRRYPAMDGSFAIATPDVGESLTLSPNFNGSVLYVNRASSVPDADGSVARPYASLKDAVVAATNVGGFATIHVAAGMYDNETMTETKSIIGTGSSYSHKARVVIPSGVSVIGAGAGKSFIIGELHSGAADSSYGCGPDAVRCVAIESGARIVGFTLTGGRTDVGGEADDTVGGGVLAQGGTEDAMALVSDCVISNCVATRGGGAYNGVYSRCIFLDNRATVNGAAGRGRYRGNFFLYNCIVDRCAGYATTYNPNCMNCTFGGENSDQLAIRDAQAIRNSLFLGDKNLTGAQHVSACVMSEATKANLSKSENNNVYDDETCIASPSLSVADDYSPVIGANPAVDSADMTTYSLERHGAKDVYGNERFVNGCMLDVGAVETSWLEAYATRIGKKVVVAAADGEVMFDDAGIIIPSGRSLCLSVGTPGHGAGLYELAAMVNGEICALVQDGVVAPHLVNGQNRRMIKTTDVGLSSLVLTADGCGSTVLGGIIGRNGFVLSFH